MKTPSILLLAGVLVLAGGAALLARVLLAKPAAPVVVEKVREVAPEAPKEAVLVASRDLKPGEFIDTAAVEWHATETQTSPLLYFVRSQDTVEVVLGATVRQTVNKGDALASNLVVHPGEPGFVAAVLKPGMRAISVPTSAVASNSGLVSSGDRVDVILSLKRSNESAAKPGALPRLASQTLLRDVRVLALNNVTRSELNLRDTPADSEAKKKRRRDTEFYDTVTLEVSPKQAERLALSREIGTLQLALRGAAEPSNGPQNGPRQATTLTQATSIYNSMGSKNLQMYRGAQVEELDLSH